MKYSIIVPVYKVEKYLRRCIDSILRQTIQDFELILVDDGSPDDSGKICDEYAEKDSRIIVIHKENGGVSSARNIGIDKARGTYIVFVDSDDEVLENYLEGMDDSEADLVVSGVKHISIDGNVQHTLIYQTTKCEAVTDILVKKMLDNKSINFIYAKRYRTELIRREELYFALNIHLGEDTFFCAKYICSCIDIQFKDTVSYLYYKYDTVTLTSFNENFIINMDYVNELILDVLESKISNIETSEEWRKRCWFTYYYSIFYILREWNVSAIRKIRLLQQIFNNKQYRNLEKSMDILMKDDSKIIKKILKTRSGIVVFICWKILEIGK